MPDLTLVVVGDPAASHMQLLKRLPDQVRVIVSRDPDELKAVLPKADLLLNGGFFNSLFKQVFPFATQLQWIHNMSTGVEGILSPEILASTVPLTNGRGVFSSVLAEFVAGSILYFAKDFRRMIRNQTAGTWSQFDIMPVKGAMLAIVGYGDIGRASAKLANALGMHVVALRRRASKSAEDPQLRAVYTHERLHEMLVSCDYLLVAAPHTPETHGMIGEAELNALKNDAVVINVGRGPIIDESALVRVLKENRIKGAALDVFDREPLPEGHAFYKLDNVLLSPHSADHTVGWLELAVERFIELFGRFRNGEPLDHIVDKKAGY